MIEQQTNRIYDYWQWPNLFNHKELVEMHDLFNKYHVQNAIDSPAKGKTKLVNLKMTHWGYFKSKLQPLEQRILKCNQDYFGYSLFPQYDDNMIMLNEYDSKQKGEYDWHTDGSGNHTYDIKFTVLINASLEPYEGGDFSYFRAGEKPVPELNKPGNVIMFKSHLSHKVYPVISGKRHTIAIFYIGPRFI